MSQLEYAVAFDRAARWLDGFRPPFLAIVSTPEYADHVLYRATAGLTLMCENQDTVAHVQRRFASGLLPKNVSETSVIRGPGESLDQRFDAVVWAMPRRATLTTRIDQIWQVTALQARLVVFAHTRVGSLARPFRAGETGHTSDPSNTDISNTLQARGWRIDGQEAFGGLLSIGWALAGRAALLSRRPDLADRAEQAHHTAVESRIGASYALVQAVRP